MVANEQYQIFGLAAVSIVTLGLAVIPLIWPKDRHATFSQHVARHRTATVYYSLLFAITLPLLALFFTQWFVPRFQLPGWFSALIIISCIAQFACTLVPEIGGWRSVWHRALAGVSAALLLPVISSIVTNSQVGAMARIIAFVSLCGMLITVGMVAYAKGQPRNFLFLQAGYFGLFFGAVLAATYLV